MSNLNSGFLGSPAIITSTAEQELVEKGIFYHKFSFFNYETCTISINGSDPIYLAAEQGFSSDFHDVLVKSFIIKEANIRHNWVGAFKYASIFK